MFENPDVDPELGRVFEPAAPVWVDLRRLHPASPTARSAPTPLVRRYGLDLNQRVAGELHAWIRTRRGDGLAVVSYDINTRGVFGTVRLRSLVANGGLHRRRPGEPADDGDGPF